MANTIDWTKRYGDIVWAKAAGNFPFWPARIFDPDSSYMPDYLKLSKSCPYAVVFYGDGTYSSASSKTLKEFLGEGNDDALRSKQKISSKYSKLFPTALRAADADFARPEGMRQPLPEFFKDDNSPHTNKTKKKKVAQSEVGSLDDDDKLGIYDFADIEEDEVLREILDTDTPSGKIAPEEVDEDEQGEEGGMPDDAEDEMEEEEEDVDEDSKGRSAAKRKRPDSKANRDRRPSTSSQPESSRKKKKTLVKKSDMASSSSASKKKTEAGPVAMKTNKKPEKPMTKDFKQETREDRLLRLVKNLTTSTSEATLDEQSALKTLNKIADMNLNTGEFEIGDVVKIVASLRKSGSNKDIREKARSMRQHWIQMTLPTTTAPPPPPPPPPPSDPVAETTVSEATGTLTDEYRKTPGTFTTATITTTAATTTTTATTSMTSKVEFKTPASSSFIQSKFDTSSIATISGKSLPSYPGTAQTVAAVVRAEEFPRLISSLPSEVLESIVRSRAVRLMFGVLLSIDAAAKVEDVALTVAEGKMDRYFECISRLGSLLKRQDKSAIKKSLLALSGDEDREWPERKLEMEHILRSTFDYV